MKYLGVDWGLKKIGLSVSSGDFASPLKTIQIKDFQDGIEKIVNLAKIEKVDMVIVGQPEGNMGRISGKVIMSLRKRGLEAVGADETLSTREAQRLMLEMGNPQKKRKDDNAVSAAIILQRYLDEK